MGKVTIVFGVVLIVVGVAGFVYTGSHFPTALIPAVIGLLLVVCGVVALSEDTKRRMLWMHAAVAIGGLGFLGTVKSAYDVYLLSHGVAYEHPVAVEEKAATCLLCVIFMMFCVRSFINARRTRLAV